MPTVLIIYDNVRKFKGGAHISSGFRHPPPAEAGVGVKELRVIGHKSDPSGGRSSIDSAELYLRLGIYLLNLGNEKGKVRWLPLK